MDAGSSVQGSQGHWLVFSQEATIHGFRESVASGLVERMLLGQDFVEDNPECPHVDFSVVCVRQVPFGIEPAAHLRRDVRQRADLRARAGPLREPFSVVEVA